MAQSIFHKKAARCGHCSTLYMFKLRGKTCPTCKFGILQVTLVPKGLVIPK